MMMSVSTTQKKNVSIHQIVDKDGRAYSARHTEPLWVDRSETNVFSEPTTGNKITPLTSGKEYFADLIHVCDSASDEIYIAGWQVNWDALLAPGVRLYDVLYRAARRGVHIYVMPWDDTEPVQTYDDQTKAVLERINERLKLEKGKADKCGKVCVYLCKSYASVNNGYYSHHQKQVLIDRKIAYVGGMDLAYGRMDDACYDLHADSDGRQVLNRYNPGIPPLQKLKSDASTLVDPDLLTGPNDNSDTVDENTGEVLAPSNAKVESAHIAAGGWQVRYGKAGMVGTLANTNSVSANTCEYTELDAKRQPRMPWQDVHSRIEGPAVSNLLRNFILRWNTVANKEDKLALPKAPKEFEQPGKAQIQVLRSAPAAHVATEQKANSTAGSAGTQQDIHIAMKNLIAKARRFIYIENQFFVSDFGNIGGEQGELSPAAQFIKDGGGGIGDYALRAVRMASKGNKDAMDRLPQNGVLKALLARFKEIIVDDVTKPKFHVYITLPVHPEGGLDDATIAVQVYFTMQTLVYGSHSLINGIRRCIKARELKDSNDAHYMRVINNAENTEYESIDADDCYEYVTLLNLRNWAQLGDRYVTEQIYVHSKLMIVDDRFALLGSANINDRSLLGERDSEIAVLVMDEDTKRADINGKGSNQPVRCFAHDLRKKIWGKLFGITGGVRAAAELQSAVDEPGHPESWKKIQDRAKKNAALYEAAFPYIPRNSIINERGDSIPASILPTWESNVEAVKSEKREKGRLRSLMPFSKEFWDKPTHTKAVNGLSNITGFVAAIPIEWTKGENIWIKFPTALIVKNEGRDALPVNSEANKTTLAATRNYSIVQAEG
jgi:phospholipase D1/2